MGREERGGGGGGGRVSGAEESERKGKGGRGFRITPSAFFAASYVVVGASCLSERIPEKSKNPFISACYPKKKGRRREKSGFRSFTFCTVPRPTFFRSYVAIAFLSNFPFSVLCTYYTAPTPPSLRTTVPVPLSPPSAHRFLNENLRAQKIWGGEQGKDEKVSMLPIPFPRLSLFLPPPLGDNVKYELISIGFYRGAVWKMGPGKWELKSCSAT